MDTRWKDAMEQGKIGGMPLLMGMSCMLLVAERLTDGEIITISVLHFNVCMGQREVNPHIYFFFHNYICNDIVLFATCRKLRPILYLDPFTCVARGIGNHILKTLMPRVVRCQQID
jgi:hypothetical protein